MSVVKMLSPAYWYLLAAKLGARVLLILGGIALMVGMAAATGAIDIGGIVQEMLRSLIGV